MMALLSPDPPILAAQPLPAVDTLPCTNETKREKQPFVSFVFKRLSFPKDGKRDRFAKTGSGQ